MKSHTNENAAAQSIMEICDDNTIQDADECEDEIETKEIR